MVDLRVIHKSSNVTLGTWTLATTDIIGTTVGGNRYGWFVQNEIDDLAIDNSERTGILSTPGCEIEINDGGKHHHDRGRPGRSAATRRSPWPATPPVSRRTRTTACSCR